MKNNSFKSKNKSRFFLIYALAAVLMTIAASPAAFAADGDLDATFDGDGKVSTDVGAASDSANNAVQQTDGKIVTVGTTRNTNDNSPDNLLLARYNTNGSLDQTFGTGGTVGIIDSTNPQFFAASGIALQGDGKILVTISGNRIFRFNQNGSRDTTFGTNGALTIAASGTISLINYGDVKVLPDGKILVCGTASNNTFIQGFGLARLNQDGSLDTSFGTGGIVRTAFTTGTALANASEMDVAANGKIALGGSVGPQTTPAQVGIAVYNANGSPDTTFNTDGKLLVPTTNVNFFGSIAQQTDGKIVICGRKFRDGDTSPAPYLQRFTATGTPDTAFGTNSEVFPTSTNRPLITLNDVAVQPDGKILGFGSAFVSFQGNLSAWLTVVRVSPSGVLDATFGANGIVTTPFNTSFSGNQSQALAGFLQTDGKIVAAGVENVINPTTGTSNVNIAIARYSNTAGNPTVNNPTLRFADFDGDSKSDVSVFRSGTWFINPSSNPSFAAAPSAAYGVQFGQTGDITVPADYDGDGKSDIAVWRGAAFANFYILNSSNNTFRAEQFGTTGDNPTVSGDWDADGKADLAVYRGAAQSFFYYRPSAQAGVNFVPIQWGTSGDTPIFGDFDGDRRLDATIYRPANNTFYVRQSSNGVPLIRQWGNALTDAIFAGDFDGDGKSDFAVQRFSGEPAGTWYVLQSSGTTRAIVWGLGSDVPVPADYDGDGRMDVAVFRRSNRTWYILGSSDNTARYSVFGASTDFPLPLNLVR